MMNGPKDESHDAISDHDLTASRVEADVEFDPLSPVLSSPFAGFPLAFTGDF